MLHGRTYFRNEKVHFVYKGLKWPHRSSLPYTSWSNEAVERLKKKTFTYFVPSYRSSGWILMNGRVWFPLYRERSITHQPYSVWTYHWSLHSQLRMLHSSCRLSWEVRKQHLSRGPMCSLNGPWTYSHCWNVRQSCIVSFKTLYALLGKK